MSIVSGPGLLTRKPNPCIWDFPKIRVPCFGVHIIRILLFRVLYWGPLFSEIPRPKQRETSFDAQEHPKVSTRHPAHWPVVVSALEYLLRAEASSVPDV